MNRWEELRRERIRILEAQITGFNRIRFADEPKTYEELITTADALFAHALGVRLD